MFLICHVTSRDHIFKGLCYFMGGAFHGKSPPCHVGSYWSCASGDIRYLICHVTSKNHMVEGSCNFMSGNFSLYVTTLPSLVAIGIMIERNVFSLSLNLARPLDQIHVTVWIGTPQIKSLTCQVWWPQALWQWRYNGFSLSRDLARPNDQSVM